MRTTILILSLISLLIGGAVMLLAFERAEELAVSRHFVVPAVPIPAYTVIEPDMLTEKEFSRALADEPIYLRPEELADKITAVPLNPGQLIYHSQALAQAAFRLTDDPTLEVLSFPVTPSQSVGGRIRIGHRIHIYRLVALRPREMGTAAELLARDAAAVELLAENLLVVDVRPASAGDAGPSQTLTVAAPHQVAAELVKLVGEREAQYDLWVSLAPAVTSNLAERAADEGGE